VASATKTRAAAESPEATALEDAVFQTLASSR
jgi:hypothetical protein